MKAQKKFEKHKILCYNKYINSLKKLLQKERKNKMNLINESASRKIDDLGRITIPKNMRKRLEVKAGEDLDFYSLEYEGKYYVCLTSKRNPPSYKYKIVTDIFKEYNIEIPKEFLDAIAKETFETREEK